MANKRMRLPNGFGQISKINNARLRNPYRAMITVGKTDEGRPICKILKPQGYFRTYNEAYSALMEYNKHPYELDNTTLKEVYDAWFEKYKPTVSDARLRGIQSAWKRCKPLESVTIRSMRPRCIRDFLDKIETTESPTVQSLVKQALNSVFDYAVEYELVERNIARECRPCKELSKRAEEERTPHIAFTYDELEILWSHTDDSCVRAILIQCYSGWRPSEFLNLRLDSINSEQQSFKGGSKTASGKNRIVPIHPLISPLVLSGFDEFNDRLFNGGYHYYLERFRKTMEKYGLNPAHRPHDARKTFVTLAKKNNVDEYAIKRIVGHTITDLTERVYTDRDYAWLKAEIEKIK